MHKFKASFVFKHFKRAWYKYIFIDEISMVQELFHNFFLFVETICPDVKLIISSDFEQLLPVKDRIGGCGYKK